MENKVCFASSILESLFVKLKAQKEKLKERLRSKVELENLLAEKDKLKKAEVVKKIEKLQLRKHKLKDENKHLKDKLVALKLISTSMMVLVIVLMIVALSCSFYHTSSLHGVKMMLKWL
ncbi:conserved hypothetical protein [Ricinus communis]|uniref:Uncharacterized protein n=1 Tax=Ricinus communis TaxID=3988 RepID=B9REN3_RICCO|nr:conserved hypothetical protein [Ricinus communis]